MKQDSTHINAPFGQESVELDRAQSGDDYWINAAVEAILINRNGVCLEVNRSAVEMFGYGSASEMEGLHQTAFIAEQSQKHFREQVSKSREPFEAIGKRVDGTFFPVEIAVKKMAYRKNQSANVTAIRDITARKEAEQRYKIAAQVAGDLLYEWHMASDQLVWFGNMNKTLGYQPQEFPATKQAWEQLIHPDDLLQMKRSDDQHLTSTEPILCEYRVKHKDGSWRFWSDRAMPIVGIDQKPHKWVGVCADITPLRRSEQQLLSMQEQLQQSQKLEAVGRLAGGVAHDMNNIIGAILGSASVLELNVDLQDDEMADVRNILRACRKGRDLTRNLLGFARKGKYVRKKFSINQVTRDTSALLARTISKGIEIKIDLDRSIDFTWGDENQIEHALMNICINAADAMDGVGVLTITTSQVDFSKPHSVSTGTLSPGPYVACKVKDTGMGMTSRLVGKIFEPFFTTKPKDKGTGLGLSMVYGTVKNHSGGIQVLSSPNQGTEITIFLPAVVRVGDSLPPQTATARFSEHKSKLQTILLVDDEPVMLSASRRILTKMGYSVLVAASGQEAINIVDQNVNQIKLVMLDMIMPAMDGFQTFHKLKKRDPSLKVLLCSGYSKDEKVDALLASGAVGFLDKPFDFKMLANEIEKVV